MKTKKIANENPVRKSDVRKGGLKESIPGYLFIAPMLLGSGIIILYPIIASFILSFTESLVLKGQALLDCQILLPFYKTAFF